MSVVVLRALVVAEDASQRATLHERVSSSARDVVEVSTVAEAIAEPRPVQVVVIAIDLHSSATANWQALATLIEAKMAPVIVVTTRCDPAALRRALLSGAEDVVDWDAFTHVRAAVALEVCVERSRSRIALERAYQRAAHLHSVASALAVATSEEEVTSAILDGVTLLGATATAISFVEAEDLVLTRVRHYPSELVNRVSRLPLSGGDNPLSEAARTGRPVWIERGSERAHSAGCGGAASGHCVCMPEGTGILPLTRVDETTVIGVVAVSFDARTTLDAEDRLAFEGLASVFTQAIARARAHAELRTRVEREQRLLGVVAHDVRSPLNIISMSTDLLGAIVNAADRPIFERLKRATAHTTRLVGDLVDYSSTTLGVLRLEPSEQDLFCHLSTCIDDLRSRSPSRPILLHCVGDGVVRADAGRVMQAATNLICNAVAYGAPGTPIRVEARGTPDRFYIEVSNEGPPIAAESIATLFQATTRATNKESRVHLGLGLFITKGIAEAHGGRVWVRSDAHNGTTFTFEIPRDATHSLPSSSSRMRFADPAPQLTSVPASFQALSSRFVDDGLRCVLLRWLAIGGERHFPHPRRMEDPRLIPFSPDIAVVAVESDVELGEPRFRLSEVGGALERRLGAGLAGKSIGRSKEGESARFDVDMQSAYRRCLQHRSPVYDYVRLRHVAPNTMFERLILPCSNGADSNVTHLYTIARFTNFPDSLESDQEQPT